jgi:hypothetical protein
MEEFEREVVDSVRVSQTAEAHPVGLPVSLCSGSRLPIDNLCFEFWAASIHREVRQIQAVDQFATAESYIIHDQGDILLACSPMETLNHDDFSEID